MPTDQLHWLSVRELLCGFRAGAFTPMEVLDHLVERIEELDKATGINAIVDLQIDSARELALAATRRYQEGAGASSSVDSSHRDADPHFWVCRSSSKNSTMLQACQQHADPKPYRGESRKKTLKLWSGSNRPAQFRLGGPPRRKCRAQHSPTLANGESPVTPTT